MGGCQVAGLGAGGPVLDGRGRREEDRGQQRDQDAGGHGGGHRVAAAKVMA
jgi:hypothetical protein